MSICDDMKNWKDMSANERFTAVRDAIKGWARESGFGEDVRVVRQPPPGQPDRAGAYRSDTDTIYLHPGNFTDESDEGFANAYDTAAHEFAHHVQDEVDNDYDEPRDDAAHSVPVPEDEADGEVTLGHVRPVGEDGELVDDSDREMTPEEMEEQDRHDEAEVFAEELLEVVKDACKNPRGAESAIRSFIDEWLFERGMDDDDEPTGTRGWDLPSEMVDA